MNLTHIRIEDGVRTLVTVRDALAEIEGGMMAPDKGDISEMAASGSSATIHYRDGRRVTLRPATPEQITEFSQVTPTELRTDELKPGMRVKLKSRAGTLPQNEWFTVGSVETLPRKQFAPLGSATGAVNHRPFAARTLWLVQA